MRVPSPSRAASQVTTAYDERNFGAQVVVAASRCSWVQGPALGRIGKGHARLEYEDMSDKQGT